MKAKNRAGKKEMKGNGVMLRNGRNQERKAEVREDKTEKVTGKNEN